MRAALLLAFAMNCSCSSEPDFDERYDTAKAEIEDRAAAMERELGVETREEPEQSREVSID